MYTLVWVNPEGKTLAKAGFNHPVHVRNWINKYIPEVTDYVVAASVL